MAYRFDIIHRPTNDHGNAAGLPRLSAQIDCMFDQFENRENEKILSNIEDTMSSSSKTQEVEQNEALTQ